MPNSTAETASIISDPPPTPRSARRWTASSGCAVRSSSAAKAARPTSAAAPSPSVCVDAQPALSACEAANTSAPRLSGRQQRAAEIEAAPAGARRVGRHDVQRAGAERQPDGQVDEEDQPPVDELGQRAAEQHAERRAGAADRAPRAQRLGPLAALGERAHDDRERRGGEHGGAEALTGAGGEQRRRSAGERRGERRQREHAQAGEEHAPAPEQVGGAPAEQQQAAEDQRVARDRPADVTAADVEVLRHVGKRDVHGRDVEDHHQLGDAEQDEQAGSRSAVGVLGRRAVGGGASGGLQSSKSDNSVWTMKSDSRV